MERVLGVARGSNARTSGTGAVRLRSAQMTEQQNKYLWMVRFDETFLKKNIASFSLQKQLLDFLCT